MTDRIKLTDKEVLYEPIAPNGKVVERLVIGTELNLEHDKAQQLKQQILDDQEKAEKWDKLMKQYGVTDCEPEDIMKYIMDKRSEIKQLKISRDDVLRLLGIQNKKLEKIFQWHDDFINPATVWKRLEEMKKENKS